MRTLLLAACIAGICPSGNSASQKMIPVTDDSIIRVGDRAPDFRVARLDGSPVSLADFRGKRVLIQSWASW